jgi:hypothetical protein
VFVTGSEACEPVGLDHEFGAARDACSAFTETEGACGAVEVEKAAADLSPYALSFLDKGVAAIR